MCVRHPLVVGLHKVGVCILPSRWHCVHGVFVSFGFAMSISLEKKPRENSYSMEGIMCYYLKWWWYACRHGDGLSQACQPNRAHREKEHDSFWMVSLGFLSVALVLVYLYLYIQHRTKKKIPVGFPIGIEILPIIFLALDWSELHNGEWIRPVICDL